MKINNSSMMLKVLFDLEEGDIFLYDEHYYIAGDIYLVDHRRECYDLTMNTTRNFTINHTVYAWNSDDCELIIR